MRKDKIKILVTGAGAPGISGTLYSLRNNPDNQDFFVITTDIQKDPVGKYLSDAFYVLPAPESTDYLTSLQQVIETEHVDVILPQTTREIEWMSTNKTLVESWGCRLALSDREAISRANDKYLILKACEECNVPFPAYKLVSNVVDLKNAIIHLGYPNKEVIVKPRLSNGQRGVRLITPSALTIKDYLGEKPSSLRIDLDSFMEIFQGESDFPELLVTEFMPGDEYTIDMYNSDGHQVVIPRKRDAIRSGISFVTTVDLGRSDMVEYSIKLANYLQLNFCFGFQFKLDSEGVPKILESNPRVQGTMVASTLAGFNMIYYAVQSALGNDCVQSIEIKDKSCFKRLWGGIATTIEGDEIGRI